MYFNRLVSTEMDDPSVEVIYKDDICSRAKLDVYLRPRMDNLPLVWDCKFLWDIDKYGVEPAKMRNQLQPLQLKLEWTGKRGSSKRKDDSADKQPESSFSGVSLGAVSANSSYRPSPSKRSRQRTCPQNLDLSQIHQDASARTGKDCSSDHSIPVRGTMVSPSWLLACSAPKFVVPSCASSSRFATNGISDRQFTESNSAKEKETNSGPRLMSDVSGRFPNQKEI